MPRKIFPLKIFGYGAIYDNLSILRGVRFLLPQWDAYVNSILLCVVHSSVAYESICEESKHSNENIPKKMTHIQSFLDKTYSNGSGKQPCCQIILILSVKGYDLQNKQVPLNFCKQDLQQPFFSNFDFVNFDILSAIREAIL